MSFALESNFEDALVQRLVSSCGWKGNPSAGVPAVLNYPDEKALLDNWAKILYLNNNSIDRLDRYPLTGGEMQQILTQIDTLHTPLRINGFINGKTLSIVRDNPDDVAHFGQSVTLKIYDRTEIAAGKSVYQIVRQPRFPGSPLYPASRGDLELLVNGMPVVHIELKRSRVSLKKATDQIERYSAFNVFSGIFALVQVFVAMTPEDAVYFANPGPGGVFDPQYFFHWARANNEPIEDWEEVASTLLSIPLVHEMIGFYTVADTSDGMFKVLRSYQYYASSAIFRKVADKNLDWQHPDRHGGYVWHTTGAGKTLTCFKTAQLITESGCADKIVFLMDRIELTTQTFSNFKGFAEDPQTVNDTGNTDLLRGVLANDGPDKGLIVTSIQKMAILAAPENARRWGADLRKINSKRIVILIDECHRSVFGDMLKAIQAAFPKAIFFGFTGTPIMKKGPRHDWTTAEVFGSELHRYPISSGIRDKNVLGFDRYAVATFSDNALRNAVALEQAKSATVAEAMADPAKRRVYQYWMNDVDMVDVEAKIKSVQYDSDKHRTAVVDDIIAKWTQFSCGGAFHAILATSSIDEAIEYYNLFRSKTSEIRVAALFDPNLDCANWSAKSAAIGQMLADYNGFYGTTFTFAGYSAFKSDICLRLAHKKPYESIDATSPERLDLLIVVDQMLTGYDSHWLNTLYLDKTLEDENIIQAISRTNRLCGGAKQFGVIRWYRKVRTMERRIEEAIKEYSSDHPEVVWVCSITGNLKTANDRFARIKALFTAFGADDFGELPEDEGARGQFARDFKDLFYAIESARVQGFAWDKADYAEGGGHVHLEITRTQFETLMQRYRELSSGSGGAGGTPPPAAYDIDPYIEERRGAQITYAYMDSTFRLWVKALQDRVDTQAVLDELHRTFASLSGEDQRLARVILSDVESSRLKVDTAKTLSDYLNEYRTRERDLAAAALATAIGCDSTMLAALLDLNPSERRLNRHGRLDALRATVDRAKARAYLQNRDGTSYSGGSLARALDDLLRAFILSGGKSEGTSREISSRAATPRILAEIAEELKYRTWLPVYTLRAACGKFGEARSVEAPEGWIEVKGRRGRSENLYVVKAAGHSMEPTIKDGEYCVFEFTQGAFASNDIVLAEYSGTADVETGGAYSIKKIVKDGETVKLVPENPEYPELPVPADARGYRIVGVRRSEIKV